MTGQSALRGGLLLLELLLLHGEHVIREQAVADGGLNAFRVECLALNNEL